MIAALLSLVLAQASPPLRLAIVVGNNAPPAGEALVPLHYADDDAASIGELLQAAGTQVTLLTVMDTQTQSRFPQLRSTARAPTHRELALAAERTARAIDAASAADRESELWLFFAGHGFVATSGEAAFSLLDGPFTRSDLHALLDTLHPKYIHLIVDACHSESFVSPRGKRSAPLEPSDAALLLSQTTLERFPHVGALLGSSSDQKAQEWSSYEHGVFTHQVLSAMRGAADVNGDARIEYSEVAAFLAAANRDVGDRRAHLDVLARPPPLNARAPLFEHRGLRDTGFCEGELSGLGRIHIEDERGVRLLDLHAEAGYALSLALPANKELFIRTPNGEASFRLAPNAHLGLATLRFRAPSSRDRGALGAALSSGLFASAFGPIYYRAYIDHAGHESVSFAPIARRTLVPSPASTALIAIGAVSLGAAAGLGAVSVVNLTNVERAPTQRTSQAAFDRSIAFAVPAIVAASAGVACLIAGVVLRSRHGDSLAWQPTVFTSKEATLVSIAGRF